MPNRTSSGLEVRLDVIASIVAELRGQGAAVFAG
jgi:hypothetical protein